MLLLYCILDSVPNRRCDESAVAKQKLDMGRQDTERRARAKVCVRARAGALSSVRRRCVRQASGDWLAGAPGRGARRLVLGGN